MKEFLFQIRTEGDHLQKLSPDNQQEHLQKVGAYIVKLLQKGKLKRTQPLICFCRY